MLVPYVFLFPFNGHCSQFCTTLSISLFTLFPEKPLAFKNLRILDALGCDCLWTFLTCSSVNSETAPAKTFSAVPPGFRRTLSLAPSIASAPPALSTTIGSFENSTPNSPIRSILLSSSCGLDGCSRNTLSASTILSLKPRIAFLPASKGSSSGTLKITNCIISPDAPTFVLIVPERELSLEPAPNEKLHVAFTVLSTTYPCATSLSKRLSPQTKEPEKPVSSPITFAA